MTTQWALLSLNQWSPVIYPFVEPNKSDNEINQNDENFDNALHKTSNDVKTNNVELSSISSEENQAKIESFFAI